MNDFSHFDRYGRASMVDISDKPPTERTATAYGRVRVNGDTFRLIISGGTAKGDVLGAAQIAGIMAAKRTWELIPMCHPLTLSHVEIKLEPNPETNCIDIYASAKCFGMTGLEMEALTAVSTAALTVYDMCKAVQKDITIEKICLLEKTGGKSGTYRREETIQ